MQNPTEIKLKLICFASYKEQKVTVIEQYFKSQNGLTFF